MPSQEEKTDSLLNDLSGKKAGGKSIEEEQLDMSDIEALLQSVTDEVEQETADRTEAPNIDDIQGLLEEDVERLLTAGKEQSENGSTLSTADEIETDDIISLLNQSDDANLQEIQDLLQKSDNNEAVNDDIVSLLQGITDESEEQAMPEESVRDKKAEREEQRQAKLAAKEAKKAERAAAREAKKAEKAEKKSKAGKNKKQSAEIEVSDNVDISEIPVTENTGAAADELLDAVGAEGLHNLDSLEHNTGKQSIFSRIINFLTEEDEEEDTEEDGIKLSDENRDILKEMGKEKGKKKGKRSGKGGRKALAENEGNQEAGDDSQKDKKAKKEKKPKKEKIKKEKPPKEEAYEEPGKKLSIKRIILITLICLSFGLATIIIANVSGDFMSKKEGRKAYYSGDYQTCYQNLYGKDLDESEQVMYSKSESILRIRLWIREYELFAEEGAEAEALDSLLQSVQNYPALYDYSVQWNAGNEVAEGYAQILSILSDKYHLTEEQAKEIGNNTDDIEYTKIVTEIAQGKDYTQWKNEVNVQESVPELLDQLPEEAELPTENFVDNNVQ